MNEFEKYKEICQWLNKHQIMIGDQIEFDYKNKMCKGYLTGFDLNCSPIKAIVRFISDQGKKEIVVIDDEKIHTAAQISFNMKTSNDWYIELDKPKGLVIYDPDGWDRKNFHYSWYEELITLKEYRTRVLKSTCLYEK